MPITIEAIYEDGVFKPLQAVPKIKDHERVKIAIEPQQAETQDMTLEFYENAYGSIKDPAVETH